MPYLGVPHWGWELVVDSKCRNSKFSEGSKLTLIQHVLSRILTCYMHLFKISIAMAKILEKYFSDFSWHDDSKSTGGSCVVCNIPELHIFKCDLGIDNVINHNLALVFKWS